MKKLIITKTVLVITLLSMAISCKQNESDLSPQKANSSARMAANACKLLTYDKGWSQDSYEYDANGVLIKMISNFRVFGDLYELNFVRNSAGQIAETHSTINGSIPTDIFTSYMAEVEKYTYTAGKMTKIEGYFGSNLGYTTIIGYDANGFMNSFDSSTPEGFGSHVNLENDSQGNVLKETYGSGVVIEFKYPNKALKVGTGLLAEQGLPVNLIYGGPNIANYYSEEKVIVPAANGKPRLVDVGALTDYTMGANGYLTSATLNWGGKYGKSTETWAVDCNGNAASSNGIVASGGKDRPDFMKIHPKTGRNL